MSEQQSDTWKPGQVIHGMYQPRTLTCQAPGCGKEFTTRRVLVARFCSNACRVQFGRWSFRVASTDSPRVLGVTR